MFSSIKRGARLASVVGISAAIVVGLAGPASAAPPAGQNQALGIVTTGLIAAGPFSQSQFNQGPFTDTLLNVSVPTLLSSGTVVTNASATSADASVENLGVDLAVLTALNASAVTSECSYDDQTAVLSGSSAIVGGVVDLPLILPDIVLDASAAPNTVVGVPGVATITLNRQTNNPDGSLTVDAIHVALLGSTQTVTIATSSCQAAVLVIPTIAPQFALGAGVLGLLVLGFVLYRRRQIAVPAAA